MLNPRYVAVALIVGGALSASPAAAQCSGTDSCSTTNTASVTIGALVKLEMSATTTTLTPPLVADLAAGFVADIGPGFIVHANQDWTLSIKSDAATDWSYSGTKGGVKPIGDLTWSTISEFGFTALTTSNATVSSGSSATDNTEVGLYFKTLYSSDYSSLNNRPGTYTLPIVLTLSAP
jgi:hypothetical protein